MKERKRRRTNQNGRENTCHHRHPNTETFRRLLQRQHQSAQIRADDQAGLLAGEGQHDNTSDPSHQNGQNNQNGENGQRGDVGTNGPQGDPHDGSHGGSGQNGSVPGGNRNDQ